MVSETEVIKRLKDQLSPSVLEVEDVSDGCGAKFTILVVSDAFDGKRILECHRMVQGALSDVMEDIHAVTINAYSPEKWQTQKSEWETAKEE